MGRNEGRLGRDIKQSHLEGCSGSVPQESSRDRLGHTSDWSLSGDEGATQPQSLVKEYPQACVHRSLRDSELIQQRGSPSTKRFRGWLFGVKHTGS